MVRFIKLTTMAGTPFYINPAAIEGIIRPEPNKPTHVHCIGAAIDGYWIVRETPDEILRLIRTVDAAQKEGAPA